MAARRTSNRMKLLKGTARPDRVRDEVEFPAAENPPPPDWLIDPEAVREWDEKVGLLSSAGVLTVAALSLLGQYCNMHAAAVKQWRVGDAPTAADMTQLRLMATEFGFTPASRSKIGGGGKREPANPFHNLDAG
jgi:phage terminase small subunit